MGHKTTHTLWCDKCGCPISNGIEDFGKRMTIYYAIADRTKSVEDQNWTLLFCKECGEEEMERYKKMRNSKKGQRSIGE